MESLKNQSSLCWGDAAVQTSFSSTIMMMGDLKSGTARCTSVYSIRSYKKLNDDVLLPPNNKWLVFCLFVILRKILIHRSLSQGITIVRRKSSLFWSQVIVWECVLPMRHTPPRNGGRVELWSNIAWLLLLTTKSWTSTGPNGSNGAVAWSRCCR